MITRDTKIMKCKSKQKYIQRERKPRDNQEWTIQRHRKYRVQDAERRRTKKHDTGTNW
jgi:hypothetical protein